MCARCQRPWPETLYLDRGTAFTAGARGKGRAKKRRILGTCCVGSDPGPTLSLLPYSTPELKVSRFKVSKQDLPWKEGKCLR